MIAATAPASPRQTITVHEARGGRPVLVDVALDGGEYIAVAARSASWSAIGAPPMAQAWALLRSQRSFYVLEDADAVQLLVAAARRLGGELAQVDQAGEGAHV